VGGDACVGSKDGSVDGSTDSSAERGVGGRLSACGLYRIDDIVVTVDGVRVAVAMGLLLSVGGRAGVDTLVGADTDECVRINRTALSEGGVPWVNETGGAGEYLSAAPPRRAPNTSGLEAPDVVSDSSVGRRNDVSNVVSTPSTKGPDCVDADAPRTDDSYVPSVSSPQRDRVGDAGPGGLLMGGGEMAGDGTVSARGEMSVRTGDVTELTEGRDDTGPGGVRFLWRERFQR